ncbi:MAG: helix-turn-helix transcriptional regulator [Deltaproteobacteria bacterium]|nr:helix-turn-helix transcriptional regulator [Deltaproteobacteria bacterium]
MMATSLTFGLDLDDGEDRLDPRAWKAIVTAALARTSEGLVVCDADLRILFTTPRAVHLLRRLGMGPDRQLPERLAAHVLHLSAPHEAHRSARVCALTGSAVQASFDFLRSAPPARIAIWLREDSLGDDVLFTHMKERYRISARGFRLAQLVRRGLTNRQIAEELGLTESTVKVYLHQLYKDCGVSSRTTLIALIERFAR